MSQNDTLASALSAIHNAEKVGKMTCKIKPGSKTIKKVLTLMRENHYIGSYEEVPDSKGGHLLVNLIGKVNKCAAIKPRFPVSMENYEKFEKRFLPAKDFGILIVSTNKGMVAHSVAKENKSGGKLIAYCY